MRPPRLAPLFATVRSLKGVGPKVEALLNKLLAPRHASAHARVIDLLWHLPVAVIDRAVSPRIADARIGELATLEVTVAEHRPGGGRRGARAPYKVLVEDASGAAIELVYFNADPTYLKRLLPVGAKRLVSGKLESYDGWLQMPHPDHVVAIDAAQENGTSSLPVHEPLYPLTAGLSNSVLRKAIGEALNAAPVASGMDGRGIPCTERLAIFRRGASASARARERGRSRADGPCPCAARLRRAARQPARARRDPPAHEEARRPAARRHGQTAQGDYRRASLQAHRRADRARSPRSTPTSRARTACSACCKAMSAAARRWWRCSLWPVRSRRKRKAR